MATFLFVRAGSTYPLCNGVLRDSNTAPNQKVQNRGITWQSMVCGWCNGAWKPLALRRWWDRLKPKFGLPGWRQGVRPVRCLVPYPLGASAVSASWAQNAGSLRRAGVWSREGCFHSTCALDGWRSQQANTHLPQAVGLIACRATERALLRGDGLPAGTTFFQPPALRHCLPQKLKAEVSRRHGRVASRPCSWASRVAHLSSAFPCQRDTQLFSSDSTIWRLHCTH